VALGDEATFIGRPSESSDPACVMSVEEVAAAAETLAYELLVRVGSRVPRRFSQQG
jgi:alanine racemase